jgi:hypothetical protein
VVIKGGTPQPGHANHLHAVPCGGDKEPSRRELAAAKSHGPRTPEVRAALALASREDPQSRLCAISASALQLPACRAYNTLL